MAKKKADKQEVRNGNMHKTFADGRVEIYYRWIEDEGQSWFEVTDKADRSVNRRRFIPMNSNTTDESLQTRANDEAALEDEGVPGIDGLED